jgi:hypothetical protein
MYGSSPSRIFLNYLLSATTSFGYDIVEIYELSEESDGSLKMMPSFCETLQNERFTETTEQLVVITVKENMTWTLSLGPIKEPNLLDAYLLIVGKALCLANNFESKCSFYSRVIDVSNNYQVGKRGDEIFESKKRMLGPTTKHIHKNVSFSDREAEIIDKARRSRNYIAHQGASLGELTILPAEEIIEQLKNLVPHVKNLAKGDNLASEWSYCLNEKEPAPSSFMQQYEQLVMNWIFGDLLTKL